MNRLYKILNTKIYFHLKMGSGKLYKFIVPRNILCDWQDFKLIRWLWFIWRWDK